MTKVYADLGVLLDLRAGVALTLDPDAMKKWGANWHTRVYEQDADKRFGVNYTHDEFLAALKDHDAEEVLSKSRPTKLMWQLDYIVADWQKNQKVGFVKPNFTLVVNTWPYQFVGDAGEWLIPAIGRFLGAEDVVEIVYHDPKLMYPSDIRARYTMVVMDNFRDWFEINHKFLEDNPIPSVLFVLKKFSMEKPKPDDDLMRMFEALEMTLTPLAFSRTFTMDWFSYFIPTQNPPEAPPEPEPSQPHGRLDL